MAPTDQGRERGDPPGRGRATGLVLVDMYRADRMRMRVELVGAGFDVLADVGTLRGGQSALRSMVPAAVLLDPDIAGASLSDACHGIVTAAAAIDAVVIVASRHVDAVSVRGALAAGVRGYFVKPLDVQSGLAARIRRVVDGELVVDPRATIALQRPSPSGASSRRALSDRERDVLALVAEGLTNAEIGAVLYLSRHTVKEYLSGAMRKLGVTTRVEAAMIAARDELIVRPGEAADEPRPVLPRVRRDSGGPAPELGSPDISIGPVKFNRG